MTDFKVIIIAILLTLSVFNCKEDVNNTVALNGNWKVTSYLADSTDLTSQFNGYEFICHSNGNLTIEGNGYYYNNCLWNWNEENNISCLFNIMGCSSNSILWKINQEWDVTGLDNNHCYFSSKNQDHLTMTWTKI